MFLRRLHLASARLDAIMRRPLPGFRAGGQTTKCPCAFRDDPDDHHDNKDATTTMAAVTVSANLLRTGLERSSDTRLFVQTYWDSTATDLGEDAHDAVPFWLSLDTGTVWLSILELPTPRLTTIVLH